MTQQQEVMTKKRRTPPSWEKTKPRKRTREVIDVTLICPCLLRAVISCLLLGQQRSSVGTRRVRLSPPDDTWRQTHDSRSQSCWGVTHCKNWQHMHMYMCVSSPHTHANANAKTQQTSASFVGRHPSKYQYLHLCLNYIFCPLLSSSDCIHLSLWILNQH